MTNKPMLSVERDERADFEKEVQAKAERFQPDFRRYGLHPDADYKCANNQWAWELWQKRASKDKSAAQHQVEPVACLVRNRNILTQARIAVDGKDHFSAWSEWEPSSIEYGRAVTDPLRNEHVCYEMELLFKEQPEPVAVAVADNESAAKKLAECMDYPWEHMTEKGRENMRNHAKAIINAASRTKASI